MIDGGTAGITRVAGTVDTSGADAGERGGQISVRGEKVLLDLAAVLDASGHGGGGKATVGGEWQGRGSDPNAQMTHVARGARIDVSATVTGDEMKEGKVVYRPANVGPGCEAIAGCTTVQTFTAFRKTEPDAGRR